MRCRVGSIIHRHGMTNTEFAKWIRSRRVGKLDTKLNHRAKRNPVVRILTSLAFALVRTAALTRRPRCAHETQPMAQSIITYQTLAYGADHSAPLDPLRTHQP
jgi:hypothetical protein